MERLCAVVCLLAAFSSAQVDPRGARPVVPNTRGEKCDSQEDWPFCTSDEWGSKCPSGCRIQGLMDRRDHSLLKGVEKIRSLLDQNQAEHRSADLVSKQTYEYIREKLTLDSDGNNNYYELAQQLRQRITDMKIKIDRQMNIMAALKKRVKDQVADMQRLEVDIDIKLRSCKGSCAGYTEHQVDQDSYVTLDKQIQQLDSQSLQDIKSVGSLYVMKSRPLQDIVVGSHFKSKDVDSAAPQELDVFSSVKTVHLLLEEEGSSSSPATVSKVTHASLSPSTSSSSSDSAPSTSSKSITEMSGGDPFGPGGFGQPFPGHVTSQSVSCTKSIRRTVVHTKDGPVEKLEEVVEGGPECHVMTDDSKGAMSTLFPTLSHTSSSVTTTKTAHIGGAKGSLLGDSKTAFLDPFGSDLGAFLTDTEDDVPDFHARSVMSSRVQRQAGYVGKDCVAAFQHHLNGESNGLFTITAGGGRVAVEVYCQQEGLMGGWVLIQQREGGALNFNRPWNEYRDGFGSVDAKGKGELWLGNRYLHLLTNGSEGALLKVEVEDWEGGMASAEYAVRVGSEVEGFPLHVSGYVGDAGDALTTHSGKKFSTFDRDADEGAQNCAQVHGSGWWYHNCRDANLNGVYHRRTQTKASDGAENGVVWSTFRPANYSLKNVRMFIRPATF